MEYGIQLYSLRDVSQNGNFEETLKVSSDLGYKAVEFAGCFGHTSAEVTELLKKYDLKPWGAHVGPDELDKQLDELMAFYKAVGCNAFGPASVYWHTKELLDGSIDLLNRADEKMKKEGMTLYFHNHYWDLIPNLHNQIALVEILKRTDIKIELDVCWASIAGFDAATLLEEWQDRIIFVHLKDAIGRYAGRSLGSGSLPIEKIHDKAKELGMKMIVESEGCKPTGPDEVKRCMDYLKSIAK